MFGFGKKKPSSSAIEHLQDYSIVLGNDMIAKVKLKKYGDRIQLAQYALDGMVMQGMIPYMPMITGTFVDNTLSRSTALQGSGKVCAGAPPYGRFLYMGKVMVDPETGSPWARRGVKKVVTDRPLQYQTIAHPDAQCMWFDAAKAAYMDEWVTAVDNILKGK